MADISAGLRTLDSFLRLVFALESEQRREREEGRRLATSRANERLVRGNIRGAAVRDAATNPLIPIETLLTEARNRGATFDNADFIDREAQRVLGVPRPGQVNQDVLRRDLEAARAGAPALPRETFATALGRQGVTLPTFTEMDEGQQRAVINTLRQAGEPIPREFDFFELPEGVQFDVSGPQFSSPEGRAFRERSESAFRTQRLGDIADATAVQTGSARRAGLPFDLAREDRAAVTSFANDVTSSVTTALRDVRKLAPGLSEDASPDELLQAILGGVQRGDITSEKVTQALKNSAHEIATSYLATATESNAEVLLRAIPPRLLPFFRQALEDLRTVPGTGGR